MSSVIPVELRLRERHAHLAQHARPYLQKFGWLFAAPDGVQICRQGLVYISAIKGLSPIFLDGFVRVLPDFRLPAKGAAIMVFLDLIGGGKCELARFLAFIF